MAKFYSSQEEMYADQAKKKPDPAPERGDHLYIDGRQPVTVVHAGTFGSVTYVAGHVALESAPINRFTREAQTT